jgi:hypothetical protein
VHTRPLQIVRACDSGNSNYEGEVAVPFFPLLSLSSAHINAHTYIYLVLLLLLLIFLLPPPSLPIAYLSSPCLSATTHMTARGARPLLWHQRQLIDSRML